jgi:hypothetical protein
MKTAPIDPRSQSALVRMLHEPAWNIRAAAVCRRLLFTPQQNMPKSHCLLDDQ